LAQAFFGLTVTHKEAVLDQIFALMYHVGFSYVEAYNIPVWQRIWFIKRLNKEIREANERSKGNGSSTRGADTNSAEARNLMGRSRAQVPAKLRRFT